MRTLAFILAIGAVSSVGMCAQLASTPQAEDRPVRISGGVIAGNIITKVVLSCHDAIAAHVSCGGAVRVIIGKDGHVQSAVPIAGPDVVRPALVAAVMQWVYKPYLVNGEPVEVDTTITMDVQLNGDAYPSKSPSPNFIPVELSTLMPSIALPDEPPKPVRVPGGIVASGLVKMVTPVFPPEAKCLHSGAVVMHAIIGRDGHVKTLEVISGYETSRQPTLDAIKQWVYKPFQLHGQPVEVETTITDTIDFNINPC